MPENGLPYNNYVKEREMLSQMESTNYDNYEKAILTLSAAFLAFSISFLGLFSSRLSTGTGYLAFHNLSILTSSWISFAASVLSTLSCSLVGAIAIRKEVVKLEKALQDTNALKQNNPWTTAEYCLYIIAGISFLAGVALLLIFCATNIEVF
ncbi:MAG: hypothetical protein ABSA51_02125 [Anaerolineaceae bacterium]|jgi:hypothetical protein